MDYLLIDGYNIINAWEDVFNLESHSLEDCRDKLFLMLSNYQGFKNRNIIVVFDAHMVKGSQEKKKFMIESQLYSRKRMKLPITISKNLFTIM